MSVEVMSLLVGVLGALMVVFIYQITRPSRINLLERTGFGTSRYVHSSSGFGRFYQRGLSSVLSETLVAKFAGVSGLNLELIQSQIQALGIENSISAIEVAVIKFLGVCSVGISVFAFSVTQSMYVFIGLLSLGFALFFIPEAKIKEMLKEQKQAMEAQLPQFIEQIYLCIAAGSTLQESLQYVSENMEGVLGNKIKAVFINSMYGARWSEELTRLSIELRIEPFEDFVNDIVTADATGINIEDVLKEEVDHINRSNRSRVMGQIKALESQLSPLQVVFCMIPMMGIIMFPIVIQIVETL